MRAMTCELRCSQTKKGAALRGPRISCSEAALHRSTCSHGSGSAYVLLSGAWRHAVCYCTFNAVSSITNEVCSELSSLPVNLIVTVWPMYALRLKLCWVYPVLWFRFEYVASVFSNVPELLYTRT